MANKFEATITRIFVDIERIKLRISGIDDTEVINDKDRIGALVAGFFGGGITGAVVGGTLGFSKEFIATLAAQIALGVILGSIIGPTNPITLVAVIVAGFVGMGAGLTKIEEKIRHKITNQVTEQIRSDRDDSVKKAIDLIRGKLQNGSSNLSNAIDSELQSVEDLVSQIKREKQLGERHVKECIIKLEKNRTNFEGLLTNLKSFIKNMEEVDIDFTPVSDGNPSPKEDPTPQGNNDMPHQSQEPSPGPNSNQGEKTEFINCPNPLCPNYIKKVIPSTDNFCPCCGRKLNGDATGGNTGNSNIFEESTPGNDSQYQKEELIELCFASPSKVAAGIDAKPVIWKYGDTNNNLYFDLTSASIISPVDAKSSLCKNWQINENNSTMLLAEPIKEGYRKMDIAFAIAMIGQLIINRFGIAKYTETLKKIN